MKPTILVITPMPAAPASAGNRRRLVATCDALKRGGFEIDLAYLQHEDQIYRRFGQQPPTDIADMHAKFRQLFLVPVPSAIPLKTWAGGFSIDAWCPDELIDFIAWYFSSNPETSAIVVNYVFLSRCLEAVPEGVLRIIDTHDRFADRHLQYRPFRSEPNFFYTNRASEAIGLSRADVVLAIQAAEAVYFRELVDREVRLLPPYFREQRSFRAPKRLETFGFIGHGNDPNLFSISKFAHAWSASWNRDRPVLLVAGEICASLRNMDLPGIRLMGYISEIETFYDCVDAVVAPMLMGSGLKMKVAEALAMGRPVIGTRIAFEGFDTHHPAHRLSGISDTVATISRLSKDTEGLVELTAACEDLLSRYNARAITCEEDFLARIPRRQPRSTLQPMQAEPKPSQEWILGPIILSEECSMRSLPGKNREYGTLVATENISPGTARTAGYTPLRRRWFAKPPSAPGSLSRLPLSILELRECSVSFGPEWVRDRTLPQKAREALIDFFKEIEADWSAQGRMIGRRSEELTVASCIPSFFLAGSRTTAAFVISATGAREMRFVSATALARSSRLTFTARRTDLTPVPAALVFSLSDVSKSDSTTATLTNFVRSPETKVLLLSDDLIGRLTIIA